MNKANNPFPKVDGPECDDFEERAAIMEFDGGLSREDAEREARKITEAQDDTRLAVV